MCRGQFECSEILFGTFRAVERSFLRSNYIAQWILIHATLPRDPEAHSIQGCREGQDAHIPDQKLCLVSADHSSTMQEPLTKRIVLQMDQAAPENQEVPGQQREHRQEVNLVCLVVLRDDCQRQKGTSN